MSGKRKKTLFDESEQLTSVKSKNSASVLSICRLTTLSIKKSG
jgi:hypothetical protein